MSWHRDRVTGAYTSGDYLIEKVAAPGPRGYDWYLTGPDWDYGVCDTLPEAKERAERHAARERFNKAIMNSSAKLWREND